VIQYVSKQRASMREKHSCATAFAWAALAISIGSADVARAQADVPCDSLDAPIIYGRGGSAPNQLIGRLAVDLAESSNPLTVVYDDKGACFAMAALINGEKISATAKYWVREADKIVQKTCTLAEPVDATWGSMAQLATTCAGIDTLPADVSDTIGPISGFSIVVPKLSNQQAISAEALYFIYGFDVNNPEYQVPPWTVYDAIASRTVTSAAGLLLAKAVGIPLTQTLKGTDTKNNQGSIDFITTVSQAAKDNPDAAIAFASTETVDRNRDKVNTLAFQAKGQDHGYWPDSTATALDKINLRQGRYFLWNPHHFYAKLDKDNGKIADPNVKRWIGYITGQTALPDKLSFLDIQIDVGNVPDCAMQVTRDGDVGPLQSYQPEISCNCYYETKATGAKPDSCQECDGEGPDASCPKDAPVCHYGYCEVQ